jgi:TolB-like protein/Tfp pilus assembly protein PilF
VARVLVRPFVDIGGDPAQRWFAHGLTEEIVTELARVRALEVIGGATAASYSGRPLDVAALARDLGVGYVVEGGLRRTPSRLRVSARLLAARDARVVWAQEYDRPLEVADIIAVQEDIAERVVAAIARPSGALVRAERAARRAPTASLEAYDCFLYGADYWTELSPAYHERLRACLEEALRRDPGYAAAWALLALTLLDEHRLFVRPGREARLARAQEAAETAVRLDPDGPAGWRALATARFFTGDLDQFREAARHALELAPANPDTLADLGGKLAFAGDWAEGMALVRRALDLNPAQAGWYSLPLAVERLRAKDYAGALEHARRIWLPDFYGAHLLRAAILGKLERREEGAQELATALRLAPDWPQVARADLERWQLEPALVADFIDGLARAGLRLDAERGA